MSIENDYRLFDFCFDFIDYNKGQLKQLYDVFYNINYDVCKAIDKWEAYCKDNNIEISE